MNLNYNLNFLKDLNKLYFIKNISIITKIESSFKGKLFYCEKFTYSNDGAIFKYKE